jgi:hypothetical protein
MTVGRLTSVPVLGTTAFVAFAVVASSAAAHSTIASTKIVSVKIVSVKAIPLALQRGGNLTLTPGKLSTVVASTQLGFRVSMQNGSDSRMTHVRVSLTISRPGLLRPESGAHPAGPIRATETLASIGSSQTKTVTFTHLGQVVFGALTNLTVKVGSGRATTYPVIFALLGPPGSLVFPEQPAVEGTTG